MYFLEQTWKVRRAECVVSTCLNRSISSSTLLWHSLLSLPLLRHGSTHGSCATTGLGIVHMAHLKEKRSQCFFSPPEKSNYPSPPSNQVFSRQNTSWWCRCFFSYTTKQNQHMPTPWWLFWFHAFTKEEKGGFELSSGFVRPRKMREFFIVIAQTKPPYVIAA